MQYLLLTVLFIFLNSYYDRDNFRLIRKTNYGLVRGVLNHSALNESVEYYSFKAIPYARPPVGKLRFQEPLPPDSWLGIRDADKSAEMCVQISENFMGREVDGSEDCLYIEIFEPKTAKLPNDELMPVMVWIHGGTFIFGTVIHNKPDYFMDQPVVLVGVEYRVNVFGFLSTQDEYAKGNNGLKDQVMALKWVKENIHNFGGDPNHVTIFGSSAGGASVQYQMLSPKSEGLFQRAISQSGSTLNRWAHQSRPKEMTQRLAKGLGIQKRRSKELVEALQNVDYKILMKSAFNESIVGFYTPYYAQPFAPTIEIESETAFLSESTYTLLEEGIIHNKVPYMAGFNTEEGSFGYDYINNSRVDINIYKTNPELLIPISMNINNKESECYHESLRHIVDYCFKNGSVTDRKNWIKYMSQELFVRGILRSVDFMYKLVPLYAYRLSYSGSGSLAYEGGVGHHEEVQYLMLGSGSPPLQTEADKLTSKRIITLWTNFAATGNPTPVRDELLQNVIWPKVNWSKPFLDIGTNLTIVKRPEEEDFQFWEDLFKMCGNPPYETY